MKLSEELRWRGIIYDVTDEELFDKLDNEKLSLYIGVDATAPSVHVGNLASLVSAKFLQDAGHEVYLLIGGATTRVGDPKITDEREMKSEEEIEFNRLSIEKQLSSIFTYKLVNNYDWFNNITFLHFLRDVGKYFNVNYMINKDTVKSRLETGISYTEFSYQLLQAFDYYYLNKTYGVNLQVGGQDQWGNITSGVELIRKKSEKKAYGLTSPLIVKADGTKYGKSEEGTVWLDANLTSPYDLYQYFINIPDEDVLMFLKRFTFLSKEEIETVYAEFELNKHERLAQKTLAYEVCKFIHGEDLAKRSIEITKALFSNDITKLSQDELLQAFKDVIVEIKDVKMELYKLLVDNNIASSNREANEFIKSGAISINGEKIVDANYIVNDLYLDKFFLLRRGKKKYYLCEVK